MKIYTLQTHLKSYKYPLTKIVVCMVLIFFSIYRDSFVFTKTKLLDVIVTIIAVIVVIASILCLYIAIGELFYVYVNKKTTSKKILRSPRLFSIQEVCKLTIENDIVEIIALKDNNIIKLGSSSKCKHTDWNFYDKKFYINDIEYDYYDIFECALNELFLDKIVPVIEIDGKTIR